MTFLIGHRLPAHVKKVRFGMKPEDIYPPKLFNLLDIYYMDCEWRGTVIDGEPHPNCLTGSGWPSCAGVWEIWGEQWSEWYVVLAIGVPVEKWRRICKLLLVSYREGSTTWTMVWKSSFSNSLNSSFPCIPKGGSIRGSDKKEGGAFGVRCKVAGSEIRFHPLTECRITKFFESR